MARFHGKVGFSSSVESAPGVYVDEITEREYYGDVIRESKRWSSDPQKVNDDLKLDNRVSIVSDDFANLNWPQIKYVVMGGAYWKVSSVEIQRPRLILSLGGLYNGNKA